LWFGETRNMKFNRCFLNCFHWVMLAFWQIDMCKDWKKISSVLQQVRVIFKTFISDLCFLQQISGKLISFSTIRHNVHLIQRPARGLVVSAFALVLVRREFDSWPGLTKTLIWYYILLTRRTVCGRAAGNTIWTREQKNEWTETAIVQTQSWRYKTM